VCRPIRLFERRRTFYYETNETSLNDDGPDILVAASVDRVSSRRQEHSGSIDHQRSAALSAAGPTAGSERGTGATDSQAN